MLRNKLVTTNISDIVKQNCMMKRIITLNQAVKMDYI